MNTSNPRRETSLRSPLTLLALVVIVILILPSQTLNHRSTTGIVIESIDAEVARITGIQPGDVLNSWSCEGAVHPLDSAFAFYDLDVSAARFTCGVAIQVHGIRRTQPRQWKLTQLARSSDFIIHPSMNSPTQAIYFDGLRQKAASKTVAYWRRLNTGISYTNSPFLTWLCIRAAQLYAAEHAWSDVDNQYHMAVAQAPHDNPSIQAELLYQWAESFWDRGDMDKAAQYYASALSTARSGHTGSLVVARSLLGIGDAALQRNDLTRAEDVLNQALTIVEVLTPDSLDAGTCLSKLGMVEYRRGNFGKAQEYWLHWLNISERVNANTGAHANALNNVASLMVQQGDLPRADEYYRRALDIVRQSDPLNELDVAMCLHNLGVVALHSQNYSAANDYLLKSLAIKDKLAPRSLSNAITRGKLGELAYMRGDLATATTYISESIAITRMTHLPGSRVAGTPPVLAFAMNLKQLGDIAVAQNNIPKAERLYDRALRIVETVAPASHQEADTVVSLARIMVKRANRQRAARFYDRALRCIEEQTSRLGSSDDIRSEYRAKEHRYYEEYIAYLLVQHRLEDAFTTQERFKARTLLETLATAQVDVERQGDAGLFQKKQVLKDKLNATVYERLRLLGIIHSVESVTRINKIIADLIFDIAAVDTEIGNRHPEIRALTHPRALTVADIQNTLLDKDTALLEYALVNSVTYVFVVTSDSFKVHSLAQRKDIEDSARLVYSLLRSRNLSIHETFKLRQDRLSHTDSQFYEAASRLSHLLLNPINDQIKNKRLLIVSDGALQYVPFGALPVPDARGSRVSFVPLIAEHEIVRVPSAAVLAMLRRKSRAGQRPANNVIVFADPVFSATDERVPTWFRTAAEPVFQTSPSPIARSLLDVRLGRGDVMSLPRLLFSRKEAERIVAVSSRPSAAELDFAATRSAFIGQELRHYNIIHIATHGLMDSLHPELSGLVFSMVNANGKPQNGFVTLEDIYNLKLDARLVVLSACETALGKEINGEGLVGLTRGFLYAGSSSVVASLWNVDDYVTSDLMGRFYIHLEHDRMRPAAALRMAQLDVWNEDSWRFPFYWAGFELHGEWR